MGILIQGPWGKKTETTDTHVVTYDTQNVAIEQQYPWYALSGPEGIKPKEYNTTLASLKKLASLIGQSGRLILPNGWFWDPDKIQKLINQLPTSSNIEEVPDDVA